jgi:hypothetical protein
VAAKENSKMKFVLLFSSLVLFLVEPCFLVGCANLRKKTPTPQIDSKQISIGGRVACKDFLGHPALLKAKVELWSGDEYVISTLTDAKGHFSFLQAALPKRSYQLKAISVHGMSYKDVTGTSEEKQDLEVLINCE